MRNRLIELAPITAGISVQNTGWTYAGRSYPAYNEVKRLYLLPEQAAQTCPETLGQDRAFIAALYWDNYLRAPTGPGYLADFAQIVQEAAAAGKRAQIVLLPIDFDDLTTLDPALAQDIALRRDQFLMEAKAQGLDILDLSTLLPASGYSDRWCGCGHLSDSGREQVAARIAALLKEHG